MLSFQRPRDMVFFCVRILIGILAVFLVVSLLICSWIDSRTTLPEFTGVVEQKYYQSNDCIWEVWGDEEAAHLYLCLPDQRVNVYDAQGSFLWGYVVTAPFETMCYYELTEACFAVYDENEAHCFDRYSGEYLGKKDSHSLNLSFGEVAEDTSDIQPGDVLYDLYTVYRVDATGKELPLISLPWYCHLHSWWLPLFAVMFILAIVYWLGNLTRHKGAVQKRPALPKDFPISARPLPVPLAVGLIWYSRMFVCVHLVFTLLSILGLPWWIELCSTILIGLHIHLMVLMFLCLLLRRLFAVPEDFWRHFRWLLISYFPAFISLIVVMMIHGE